MSNPEVFYSHYIEKSIKDFISRRFERAAREYFSRLVKEGRRKDILDIGTYWYENKATRQNGEFDVALETEIGYEIYDAKFVKVPFSKEEAEKEMIQIKKLGIFVSAWGIISASGFKEKDNRYIQLDLKDLYNFEN